MGKNVIQFQHETAVNCDKMCGHYSFLEIMNYKLKLDTIAPHNYVDHWDKKIQLSTVILMYWYINKSGAK